MAKNLIFRAFEATFAYSLPPITRLTVFLCTGKSVEKTQWGFKIHQRTLDFKQKTKSRWSREDIEAKVRQQSKRLVREQKTEKEELEALQKQVQEKSDEILQNHPRFKRLLLFKAKNRNQQISKNETPMVDEPQVETPPSIKEESSEQRPKQIPKNQEQPISHQDVAKHLPFAKKQEATPPLNFTSDTTYYSLWELWKDAQYSMNIEQLEKMAIEARQNLEATQKNIPLSDNITLLEQLIAQQQLQAIFWSYQYGMRLESSVNQQESRLKKTNKLKEISYIRSQQSKIASELLLLTTVSNVSQAKKQYLTAEYEFLKERKTILSEDYSHNKVTSNPSSVLLSETNQREDYEQRMRYYSNLERESVIEKREDSVLHQERKQELAHQEIQVERQMLEVADQLFFVELQQQQITIQEKILELGNKAIELKYKQHEVQVLEQIVDLEFQRREHEQYVNHRLLDFKRAHLVNYEQTVKMQEKSIGLQHREKILAQKTKQIQMEMNQKNHEFNMRKREQKVQIETQLNKAKNTEFANKAKGIMLQIQEANQSTVHKEKMLQYNKTGLEQYFKERQVNLQDQQTRMYVEQQRNQMNIQKNQLQNKIYQMQQKYDSTMHQQFIQKHDQQRRLERRIWHLQDRLEGK